MVSTQNSDSVSVAHFEGHEQGHRLNRIVASVDVVSHEEVVGLRRLSTNSKQFFQIMELAVNVTANRHWSPYSHDVGFVGEDFSCLR